ncbi:hypothetical protein CEXT_511541 [Caerostris extrusa]|uniref:Uncharacterized protein n=1 Tax=Caerostris extrusa TaxID=172846 RepID=A0AAV4R008_CAEEX|nr:hypothetical protein CEXT_511541 [Caerostris extrusa]
MHMWFKVQMGSTELVNPEETSSPETTVSKTGYDYEIRSYPAVTWVATNERNRLGLVAESKGSKRLDDYFDTKNNESIKINKTIP